MISNVAGTISLIEQNQIEVSLKNLGIGVMLTVCNPARFDLNQAVNFYTYVYWQPEQGPTLFGFDELAQRKLFVVLIGCSGIGPKMAITILEQLGISGFINAIEQQDIKLLSTVSGIGAKKAEQIIVQLKHKIDKLIEQKEFSNIAGNEHVAEVRSVLLSLNYSNLEVVRALDFIKKTDTTKNNNFDGVLRQALSFLAKNV